MDVVHGSDLKCFLSGETYKLEGYCLIYNSTIIQVYPYDEYTTNETVNLAQKVLKNFSVASQAIGGKLSGEKKNGNFWNLFRTHQVNEIWG